MKEGGIIHKFTLVVIPWLLAFLMKVWFVTCRVVEHGNDNRSRCREHENPVIVTFWHYAILYTFYHLRRESAVAMVSASRDGEYIARLAARFGFGAVRGSQNRRGFQALKETIKHLNEGRHVALVADGSQGPAMKAQPGSIFLASKSGSPILPITWSASRYWAIRSWDRLVIPKPFSRIDFFYGEPVFVPKGLKTDGIEEYCRKLEFNLNEIYRKAWDLNGIEKH